MSRQSAAIAVVLLFAGRAAAGEITRIWLTHKSNDAGRIVVNWETEEPGNSVVRYGASKDYSHSVAIDEKVTLHHVEISLERMGPKCHYSVSTGGERSADAAFKAYSRDIVRVAVVADWQGRPKLDALVRDDPHLLVTAGDNIDSLHRLCGAGIKDCTRPYGELIDAYPELFRTTPFMPVLGNHDREIRPRGAKPPAEPVYDIEATAFRQFFELPGDEWKWHFDLADFGVRFVALDFNHISDLGTTWQTCHPFDSRSAQFQWYEQLMSEPLPPFVVTVYNEKHSSIRGKEGGAWHKMFSRGTLAITGFGYFAERAEVDGFTYYNTSLSGRGDRYPDPQSQLLISEDNYILMTITKAPRQMTVELKGLDGTVLDRKQLEPPAEVCHAK